MCTTTWILMWIAFLIFWLDFLGNKLSTQLAKTMCLIKYMNIESDNRYSFHPCREDKSIMETLKGGQKH